jgi:hypothetical protein
MEAANDRTLSASQVVFNPENDGSGVCGRRQLLAGLLAVNSDAVRPSNRPPGNSGKSESIRSSFRLLSQMRSGSLPSCLNACHEYAILYDAF